MKTLFETFTAEELSSLLAEHICKEQAPGYRGAALTTIDLQTTDGEISRLAVAVRIHED